MGVLARVAGDCERGTTVKVMRNEHRQAWRVASSQDKQQRLRTMRERQQRQVEFEMLRLNLR